MASSKGRGWVREYGGREVAKLSLSKVNFIDGVPDPHLVSHVLTVWDEVIMFRRITVTNIFCALTLFSLLNDLSRVIRLVSGIQIESMRALKLLLTNKKNTVSKKHTQKKHTMSSSCRRRCCGFGVRVPCLRGCGHRHDGLSDQPAAAAH